MAHIISAFPGTGKTFYAKNNPSTALDLDSASFSWLAPGVRNPTFPDNYIEAIKKRMDDFECIFVSTHSEVRKALKYHDLRYTIVYPHELRKDEFMHLYLLRGNDMAFIRSMEENWESFIQDIKDDRLATRYEMDTQNEFITDYLDGFKKWQCDGCHKKIEVMGSYQPDFCCDGYMCGCYGMVTNPVFCDECEEKIFGEDVV